MNYLINPLEPILDIKGEPILINAAPRVLHDTTPARMETPEEAQKRAEEDPEPLLFRDVVYKILDSWEDDEKPDSKTKSQAFAIQMALFDRAHPVAELDREDVDFIRARLTKLHRTPVLWDGRIKQVLDSAEIAAKDLEKAKQDAIPKADTNGTGEVPVDLVDATN